MPENQEQPGKKQAVISLVIAAIAFFYLMFVPLYVTSFFTLILGVVGLIQAILFIVIPIAALNGIQS